MPKLLVYDWGQLSSQLPSSQDEALNMGYAEQNDTVHGYLICL